MSYCTQQDLIDRFGEAELIELTDEHGTEEVDATRIAQAIAYADALIESHIAGRFTVPLSPVPEILNELACDIVHYRLFIHGAPEHVMQRQRDAVASLRDIGAGRMSLGIDDPAPQSAGDVEYSSGERQFTSTTLEDF